MKYIHGGDIYTHQTAYDFSTNINPLGRNRNIERAAAKSLKLMAQYPDSRYRELALAIADKEGVDMEQIRCGNGAAELIFAIAFACKPRKALLVAPTFAEYEQALHAVDCEVCYYNLKERNQFEVGEEYLRELNEDLDLIFLCNPNNPIGNTISKELLLKIARICQEKHIIMVVDECFNDFLNEPQTYSLVPYLKEYENLIILKAFTKMYAMAGLRLGYALCSNADILEGISQMLQPWNISIPAQAAGIAALQEQEYVEKARNVVEKERRYLNKEFERLGLTYFRSEANFILLKTHVELYDELLKRGILIRDCSNYRGLQNGFYRVAVRSRIENRELVRALTEIYG